jgi:hypothetical protein
MQMTHSLQFNMFAKFSFDPVSSLIEFDGKVQTLEQGIKTKFATIRVLPDLFDNNVCNFVMNSSDSFPHEVLPLFK